MDYLILIGWNQEIMLEFKEQIMNDLCICCSNHNDLSKLESVHDILKSMNCENAWISRRKIELLNLIDSFVTDLKSETSIVELRLEQIISANSK